MSGEYPNEYDATQNWLSSPAPAPNLLSEVKALKDTDLLLTLNTATNSPPEEVATLLDQILGGQKNEEQD